MQSTGQTSTQAVSLVPTQGSQMIYAIALILLALSECWNRAPLDCDPALARLFMPLRPRLGTYEVCATSDLPGSRCRAMGFEPPNPSISRFSTSWERWSIRSRPHGSAVRRPAGRRATRMANRRRPIRVDDRAVAVPRCVAHGPARGSLVIRWTATLDGHARRTGYRLSTLIAISPFTTSSDITGSPDPLDVRRGAGPGIHTGRARRSSPSRRSARRGLS